MHYKWDFTKASKYFIIFSIVITVLGIGSLAFLGFNYGVDFRAGSNVDIVLTKSVPKEDIEKLLSEKNAGHYTLTTGADRVTIRFDDILSDVQQKELRADFTEQLDPGASMEINTVDVAMARELQLNALLALSLASLGILIYISFRFEWRFAVAAIVSLVHDAFIVVSVFSIFRLEVNLTFIVAVLTIIGYSINDTIVIFDRIRENLRFAKIKSPADLAALVNRSIWETLTRSINTVITVVFGALCLYIFGSESIRLFSLAILIGLIAGAYSSIFIASPIWLALRSKAKPKAAKAPATTS
ncbi:protein translocase subunit SecF [Paenibacillus sp. SYP-B4298]|uniref:protein translocase subunit SecF n=1 Tax=Paenibacillus sp. SYP-B4298 TaxID=2996034 RepID=UPI0022DD865F|nr:protein translocase subunit SecF [Paenibacillus sp. SYP-B4298]